MLISCLWLGNDVLLKPWIVQHGILVVFLKVHGTYTTIFLLVPVLFIQSPYSQHCQSLFVNYRSNEILLVFLSDIFRNSYKFPRSSLKKECFMNYKIHGILGRHWISKVKMFI